MSIFQSVGNYFRSSKAELEKVAWPSRRDTIRYGALVIAASVFIAVFFSLLDSGLGLGIDALLKRQSPATNTAPTSQPQDVEIPVQVQPSVDATTPDGKPVKVQVTPAAGSEQGFTIKK